MLTIDLLQSHWVLPQSKNLPRQETGITASSGHSCAGGTPSSYGDLHSDRNAIPGLSLSHGIEIPQVFRRTKSVPYKDCLPGGHYEKFFFGRCKPAVRDTPLTIMTEGSLAMSSTTGCGNRGG